MNNKYIIIAAILLFSFSCKKSVVYEQHMKIEDSRWDANDPAVFNVPVQDTSKAYNIYIHLRNTGEYPWRNIYFFVDTETPSQVQLKDTVEYYLADEKGKWYGKGWGQVWSHKLPYRMNIKFPHQGIYTFTIQHGMRNEKLPSILDTGILLEEVK